MNPSNCQLSHGWCGGIFPAASSGFPSPQNLQTPRPHPRRASHRRLRAPASPQRSPGSAGAPSPSPGTLVSAASALGLKQLLCHSATVRARPRPRARGLSGGGGRRAQGTGRSQRRCEPLLLLLRRQRAPAVPEGKALFFLNRGSSPSEELRSVVPLPVWFKAGSGPAVILLVNFVKSLLEKSWQCTAAAGVEVACVEGGSYAREADGQNEAVCVSSTRFSDQRPGGGHRFPCTCHQFLNSYRFPS